MKGWIMLVAAAMIVEVVVVVPTVAAQGLTPSQCNNQKDDIKNTCRNVVLMGQPSAACCQLVRAANADCVCQFVNAKLVAVLGGLDRIIKTINGCGRTVPRNFKCGSVTTPP